MNENNNIFVDGAMEIRIAGGAVRLDLAAFSSMEKDEKNSPLLTNTGHTLIMTPEGFVRLYSAMEKVAAKFLESGVLKRQNTHDTDFG